MPVDHTLVKIADLGTGVLLGSNDFNGTPEFVPPEIALHWGKNKRPLPKNYDCRAFDIYSLGATFFFISTGKRPYQLNDRGYEWMLARIALASPPNFKEIKDPNLQALVKGMMERNFENRFTIERVLNDAFFNMS